MLIKYYTYMIYDSRTQVWRKLQMTENNIKLHKQHKTPTDNHRNKQRKTETDRQTNIEERGPIQ